MTVRSLALLALAALLLVGPPSLEASDWTRFRGPNGAGESPDPAPPTEWSDQQNLAWKTELPGPGSSCPIVVGDKVLVTCWTGYGLSQEDPGDQANLKRILVCYDRAKGDELWRVEVDAELPEDEYRGMFAQHGYASHTPTSDGERVYAYFGKSGAIAYDLEGKELWRADCGDGFGAKDWGSASSPILVGDLLICSATAESNALIALDKATGKEVWRHTEEGWNGAWSTPVLIEAGGRTEMVFNAPFKLLALEPKTGEVLWHCRGVDNDTVTSSPLAHDDTVYVLSGRGGSLAVRGGGEGDVDDTHVVWRKDNLQGSIATPVIHDGLLYTIGRSGVVAAVAATGERVYQARFVAGDAPAEAQPAEEAAEGAGRRRGRGGRGGGRFGSMSYASPVVAGDLMYHFGRDGVAHVVRLGEEFEQLAENRLADGGDFSATPALSDGSMYVRSSKFLYGIAPTGERVAAH